MSVDLNWTVDHNTTFSQFFSKMLSFPLPICSTNGFPTKEDIFHQKVETYFRCCQSICTIALPGFYIFAQTFSLTRFFPKKCVNFSFLRQNKYDEIRPIMSFVPDEWAKFIVFDLPLESEIYTHLGKSELVKLLLITFGPKYEILVGLSYICLDNIFCWKMAYKVNNDKNDIASKAKHD